MFMSDTGGVSSIRFLAGNLFLTAALAFFPNAAFSSGRPAHSLDFKPPLKDMQSIEGELVWLQGALLSGNPAAYRNPSGPVAAYEQGLLDGEGQLWTFLDTPRGRELRYNPDLRGQSITVRGWQYAKSKILDIHDWSAAGHLVRIQDQYDLPDKIPWDPEGAERIESIAPIPLIRLDQKILGEDLWLTEEGEDLGLGAVETTAFDQASGGDLDLGQLVREWEESTKETGAEAGETPSVPTHDPLTKRNLESTGEPMPAGSGTSKEEIPISADRALPLSRGEGRPLTRPEDFYDDLQNELIDEISPAQ